MQLRSISLQGFKTFAQRTEVVFDAGVTAVVGPNGSGKSNTVDAFKWVLGEKRARDLRGSKMEEVIYSGGARRARASTAEVVLVIDNADHRLPVDFDEVAIRRRIDRRGQSDYFLNGSRVRRRDLMELLASTGLTTDSYAIVDQGDIEHIISCTPEQRRLLIEEAAQVRGVKAKRTEAVQQLKDLAANLIRLEDLRQEIEPRLEVVRVQAAAAREAAEARDRLDLLKGSIAWEEWREARDTHRKAGNQVNALGRRLEEARAAAGDAEDEYRRCKEELESAQDRRLRRQQAIGSARLEVSRAEHAMAMAAERVRSQTAMVEAARGEERELTARLEAGSAVSDRVAGELARARERLELVPEAPAAPPAGDAHQAREARARADRARRELQAAEAGLAASRTRCRLIEDQRERLEAQVAPAERQLPQAEQTARLVAEHARVAADAATELARTRAELKGMDALRPAPRDGLLRLGDVLIAHPGYEAALAGVLGPLLDAWAAPDEAAAIAAARRSKSQITVLYPAGGATVEPGSLAVHIRTEAGYEQLAARLLGAIVVGRDVTSDGVFTAPGLVRAGEDPRTQIATRRHQLSERIAALGRTAANAGRFAEAARRTLARANELRSAAGQRRRLDDLCRELDGVRSAQAHQLQRLPSLERIATEAESAARDAARAIDEHERRMAEHRAEVQGVRLERARWRERIDDLERQLDAARRDQEALGRACAARAARAAEAARLAAESEGRLPSLQQSLEAASARLAEAERESPDEEAELAEAARRLVGIDEARVEARLKVSTVQGNLDLARRDMELNASRMEELRARMPQGMAPEEVPGGKAREREMRHLERRLAEIGPTNPLAEQERAELEERYGNLLRQLEDISAARADLEQLIGTLREEEESRYEAVFGAVTANFQDFYAELTGGGKCTLQQVEGDDGPSSGVEILVQPPRKRMQRVSLLSSGERSLTALAVVMALQAVNPAPFTIFDEVDAALDDANVGRFGEVLQRLGSRRQFMIITHNHMTMACCPALYGVHLDESGCSHLVSVRLEDIAPASQRGGVHTARTA